MKVDPKHARQAKELFIQLFEQVAAQGKPESPSYYVPRNWFHARLRAAGIPIPDNFVDAVEWEEAIGMPEFSHRIVKAHHRKHGTDFSPMEKGARRLQLKLRRLRGK